MKEENHRPSFTMRVDNGNNKRAAGNPNEKSLSPPSEFSHDHHHRLFKQTPKVVIIFATLMLLCLVVYRSSIINLPSSNGYNPFSTIQHVENSEGNLEELKSILKNATMENNTVIITTMNAAWAEPESMFDLLLESFRIGNQTQRFLKHLVVLTLDQKAYARCVKLHPHCYKLSTHGMDFSGEASYMAPDYLKMMWIRIDFLRNVLSLGYSFVFTDADIMWFRDPFPQFHKDADFQIACDYFNGKPSDFENSINGGFYYVKSNKKTIQFYKYWYNSRLTYPGLHDQDVLNKIKFNPFIKNVGLRIRFLDTDYFGGFCQPSKDFNKVCTMHANCCIGLENKAHDLKIVLGDWRKYRKSIVSPTMAYGFEGSWTVPQVCRDSLGRPRRRMLKEGRVDY